MLFTQQNSSLKRKHSVNSRAQKEMQILQSKKRKRSAEF